MTTWTCKGPIAALALLFLTGCEAGQGKGGGAAPSKPPLSRAEMAAGVILVAPSGFCIDQSSLGRRFAVMARCDTLGVGSAAGAAPLGLITVSLTDQKTGALPTVNQVATAARLQQVTNVDQSETRLVFRAQGPTPVKTLGPRQWRGVAKIGSQTAGIAVYGPAQGEITVTTTGRDMLEQLIRRSIEASPNAK